ncbi:type VI secretion system protein TssA [Hyalangium rubrum]|uniref:Type VI secretion system protein TssA n=1 Tax=Hyalangium rubrum TaxID=3103134 RepID=A0ABU5HCF9_9BACT|nr:type VI secretion system protein TssA [Hyalangium sp. s54d21]MDY7230941.1 type VI secretion system protein TssA [Hyalangium sp. s54d21]
MAVSIEQLREKAKNWIEPVSAAAPAGAAAKTNPQYEAVIAEMAKLESVTGGAVDWNLVLDSGGKVLQSVSKDLRIATYLAFGLYQTQGLDGLATGLVVISEIMDRFWPGLFPELARLRGRANALGWLIERASSTLPDMQVDANARDRVEALDVAAARLAEVARQKFEANGPAVRPLLESVQRLKASLPADAPPPPPPPPPEVKPVTPPPPAIAPVAAPPPVASAMPAVGGMASVEAATDFLRQTGSALINAAGTLRRASALDPQPYRLLRVGLYLHLVTPPPSDASGKTSIPAPPPALRQQLERMAANGKWAEVLEEAESALTQHRFWVDLHFLSARALGELGPTYQPARQSLLTELAAWLKRMPAVPKFLFGDGSPAASGETRAWLESELAPPAASGGSPAAGKADGEGGDDEAEVLTEARKLLGGGKAPEAIAMLHKRVEEATSSRKRFRARLALAKICAASSQPNMARALYEALDKESVERGLDVWEPALAGECLEGLLAVSRPPPKAPEGLVSEFNARYHRLCLIDPSAALRVSL